MKDDVVTIAQIGCGYWGPNLLRNFSAASGCRVKTVVEASEDRRRFVTTNYPATTAVTDVASLWVDKEIDAVLIATPATTHFSLAREALKSGKHTFVEKPLAMSVNEADQLIGLAQAQNLILMAGHTFLFNGAVNYLKNLIKGGDLGQILYLYAERLNLGVIRSDINAMWNLAPHDVSIFLYILDEIPVTVSAWGQDYIQKGIEDVVFMKLSFANQVQASIHVSWLDPNKVRRTTVVGSKKMVVYDDIPDDKIIIYDKGIDRATPEMPFDEPGAQKLIHRAGDIHMPKVVFKEPLKVQADHFIECIKTGNTPLSGPNNARAVVAVLEAAHQSLREGGRTVVIKN